MNPFGAFMLVVGGGIGLFVLGAIAVEHKRAIQGGELPTHLPEDYESSIAEDLIAFTASMVMLGIVIDQTPAMIAETEAMFQ
jgi:hypothetical protein